MESVNLGAYLLGALAPEERRAMERHISGCAECQAELIALAPLPGLLRHTPFDELPETASAAEAMRPGGTAGTVPAAPPAAEPSPATPARRRRGRRRALAAAGLALAAAAAGVVVALGVRSTPPSAHVAETLRATDPVSHVSATAALTTETWGTQLQLKLGSLPSGITCHLVVHSRDGRTETAGTWSSGYGYGQNATTVPASTSVSPQDITRLDIVSGSGQTLVELAPS